MSDFYENDEPVADVVAAFERGKKGVTAPPPHVHIDHRLDVADTTTTSGAEIRVHDLVDSTIRGHQVTSYA